MDRQTTVSCQELILLQAVQLATYWTWYFTICQGSPEGHFLQFLTVGLYQWHKSSMSNLNLIAFVLAAIVPKNLCFHLTLFFFVLLCYTMMYEITTWWKRKHMIELLQLSFCLCWLTVTSRSICSPECTYDGCWGPGDAQCLACQNYRYGDRCLPSCDVEAGLYLVDNGNSSVGGAHQCDRCHEECLGSCHKEVINALMMTVTILYIVVK